MQHGHLLSVRHTYTLLYLVLPLLRDCVSRDRLVGVETQRQPKIRPANLLVVGLP